MVKTGAPVLAILFSAFFFWGFPAMANQKLVITGSTIAELRQLKPVLMFNGDGFAYAGISDPVERARANADFAALIDLLAKELPRQPYQKFAESEIKKTYSGFRLADTEDRERAISYFEKILKVVGAKDTGRFLNILLYGPILGRLVNK